MNRSSIKKNNSLAWGLGLAVILALAFFGIHKYSETHEVVTKGFEQREVAKEFSLPVIGKSEYFQSADLLSLTAARTKPVLLHFWASWCVVCREEKPEVDAFWAKHKDEDILVLGVASFDSKQAMDDSQLIKTPSFTVILDEDGSIANAYKVPALPVTVLVSADGFIVKRFMGTLQPYDYTTIENYLESLKKAH